MVEADEVGHYFLLIFLITLTLLTILTNLALIILISCKQRVREESKNLVLLSMSVADLLIGVVLMPVGVSAYINDNMLDNSWTEVLHNRKFGVAWGVLNILLDSVSLLHLVVINLIKYKSVKDPLHFLAWMTPRKAKVFSAVIWTGTTAVVMLLNVEFIIDPFCQSSICRFDKARIGFMLFDASFLAVIATNVLCFNVVRKLAYVPVRRSVCCDAQFGYLYLFQKQHNTRRSCSCKRRIMRARAVSTVAFRHRKDVSIVKAGFNLCMQTTIFFISWFPMAVIYPLYIFQVLHGTKTATEEKFKQHPNFFITSWFAWSSALINPIIHVVGDSIIKDAIVLAFRQLIQSQSRGLLAQSGYNKSKRMRSSPTGDTKHPFQTTTAISRLPDSEVSYSATAETADTYTDVTKAQRESAVDMYEISFDGLDSECQTSTRLNLRLEHYTSTSSTSELTLASGFKIFRQSFRI